MTTQTLAHWSTDLTSTTLPPSVKHAALRSLYNYIGCTIGGSNHPTVAKTHTALSPFFGPATSTLLGQPDPKAKTDAQHAALLNGIASHVHDYDDTHLATIIHPTGPVASALLAYTDYASNSSTQTPTTITGPALLTALTAGIETSCKLGLALYPAHYDIGWHITSTTGAIGAAVAVAKLMGLAASQTEHAIGLAATQQTGLREMFGSDTKSFHAGRAAQNGLLAALLAQRGFTSSERALEARRGWGRVVSGLGVGELEEGRAERELERRVGELGVTWEVEANAFKPFPCGIVCHPVIDGCIRAREELEMRGVRVEEVVRVEVEVHPLVIELTAKREPRDGLEAKFSVFHGGAVGLLFGKAGPAEYADEVVGREEVVALRDRIEATPSEELRSDEARLIVHLSSGETVEKHVVHAVGSLEVPMTDEQLTRKFVDQAALVLGEDQAKKASDAAWSVEKLEDAAEAWRPKSS